MENRPFDTSEDLRLEEHCKLPNINEASEYHTAYKDHVVFKTRFRSTNDPEFEGGQHHHLSTGP